MDDKRIDELEERVRFLEAVLEQTVTNLMKANYQKGWYPRFGGILSNMSAFEIGNRLRTNLNLFGPKPKRPSVLMPYPGTKERTSGKGNEVT